MWFAQIITVAVMTVIFWVIHRAMGNKEFVILNNLLGILICVYIFLGFWLPYYEGAKKYAESVNENVYQLNKSVDKIFFWRRDR